MSTTMSRLLEACAPHANAPVVFVGDVDVTAHDVVDTHVTSHGDATWADGVVRALGAGQRAVAALSFLPGGSAVAHRVLPTGYGLDGGSAPVVAEARHTVVQRPAPEAYADSVRAALGHIAAGEVEKVVLGRWLEVRSDPPLTPADVVSRLLATRPGRYVFGVPLEAGPDAPVLVGASPELLVRRTGRVVTSFPLAGSVPRSADPDEDARRAEALQASAKDLAEHAYVVRDIVEQLSGVCRNVHADDRPQLVSTDTLHHLGTPIRAELATDGPTPSALHLAQLLQPTPAVGGTPRVAAIDLVGDLEGIDRGMLTGAVGWVDADGDGEFAVTIRAGVVEGDTVRLFAGAGIVEGSDPAAEVRETGAKLATMLHAVGVEEDL